MTRPRSTRALLQAMAATCALALAAVVPAGSAQEAEPVQPVPDAASAVHPTAVWASSSAGELETGVNGSTQALLDDDGDSPQSKTFWNTRWRPEDPYPHALAFDTGNVDTVCGLLWTSRPTYLDPQAGQINGNEDVPGRFRIYTLPAEENLEETWAAQWRDGVQALDFRREAVVAEGSLAQTNDPQLIRFDHPVQAQRLVLAGIAPAVAGKNAMSAADLKIVPCRPAPERTTAGEAAGSDGLLRDLFLQREPFKDLSSGQRVVFTGAEHTYDAMAYHYTSTVLVHATPVNDASVSVNGQRPDERSEVAVPLMSGWNPVTVDVARGEEHARYVINILKVDTDYRGRERVQGVTALTPSGASGEAVRAVDGDPSTAFVIAQPVETERWTGSSSGIELRMPGDEPRQISKITGRVTFTAHRGWDAGRVFKVVGSRDGVTFDVPLAEQATLRNDTEPGFIYWDFNTTEAVRAIRLWVVPSRGGESVGAGTNLRFSELDVWQNAGNAPEVLPDQPVGDSISQMYDPTSDSRAWGVSRAQTLFMHYGFQVPTWVPSEGYGRGTFNAAEQQSTGAAIPMFYDPGLFDARVMRRMPTTRWALAKAPAGGNSMSSFGQPRDFLTEEMRPYAANLVDVQYGDEGAYSTAERDRYASWFAWSKQHLPGAIVHSNQLDGGGWMDLGVLRDYVRTAQPDALTWDSYEFSYGSLDPSRGKHPADWVRGLFSRAPWRLFRQVSMEGYDGGGVSPVPWGQYVDYSFWSNFSASQKNLTTMLTLAAGGKWSGGFRMEYAAYDHSSLVDLDGAPTRAWYEYADVFTAARTMSPYLMPLSHQYFATQPGDYGSGTNAVFSGYRAGAFSDPATRQATTSWGLVDVSASSDPEGMNAGRPGDVAIGYFATLPGLSEAKTAEVYGQDATDPRVLMVVNALAGETSPNAQGLDPRYDNGAAWQTRQHIVLTVRTPSAGQTLYRVDPVTGARQRQDLRPAGADASGQPVSRVEIDLDGGMGTLLYWTSPNPTH